MPSEINQTENPYFTTSLTCGTLKSKQMETVEWWLPEGGGNQILGKEYTFPVIREQVLAI